MKTLLAKAIACDNLDEAIRRPIQDALGITTGDVAGITFARVSQDQWSKLSSKDRSQWLILWLTAELRNVA